MTTTQVRTPVPFTRHPVTYHFLGNEIPTSGVVHVNFRVKRHMVPRWLPKHKNRGNDATRGNYTGEQIQFGYTKWNKLTGKPYPYCGDLHSATLDPSSFASRKLASVYWEEVETQCGPAAVIVFWWNADAPDATIDAKQKRDLALFAELCSETWDYMESYENPGDARNEGQGNISLVFKGAAEKPYQHFVSIADDPAAIEEADVAAMCDEQAKELLVAAADKIVDSHGRTWSQVVYEDDELRSRTFGE